MRSKPTKSSVRRTSRRNREAAAALAVSMLVLGGTLPAHAESLRDALSSAYLYNPTLKAARAQLRATDEEAARARSGYRPIITGQSDHSYIETDTQPGGKADYYPQNFSVTVSQPVFRGFRTVNAISQAEAAIEAGREDLRAAEHQILLQAVTSYVNVVRDQAVLNLRLNNVKVLSEQLKATQDRFAVGEVTKTDVAQAEASLAGARSFVAAARAALQASRAVYAQIVGKMPTLLRDPGPTRLIPRSLDASIKRGEGESPLILAAVFRERAQHHAIRQAQGELLPQVDLQASYTHSIEPGTTIDRQNVTAVTGRVTVPIYEGGEVYARIRQGFETQAARRHQIDEAREQVRAEVISAWGVFTAASAQIISDNAQVDANRVALAGVKEEEKVGQRTVLDVLNAEQALLDSQVQLATSRRNLVVASYALLAVTGRISSADLALPVEQYDPAKHYSEIVHQWIGWDSSAANGEGAPDVAPVTATGRTPDQSSLDGPAYESGR